VHALALATAILPVAVLEATQAPTARLVIEAGFSTGQDAAFVPAKQHLDAISAVRSDPITLPVAVAGGLALVTALLMRRRRRRRTAWGYVPAEALSQRMPALLH
jgi:hypothetical protein